MHAVLRIDPEPPGAILFHHLIYARRTVTLRRLVIQRQIDIDGYRRVLQLQMAGLVFLVIGVGQKHRRQLVETEHAVRPGIIDAFALFRRLQLAMVLAGVAQVDRQGRSEQVVFDPGESAAEPESEFVESAAEVARAMQLVVQGRGAEAFAEIGIAGVVAEGGEQGLRRQDAALDRGMAALDLGGVKRARVAADQQPAGKAHLGQGVDSTLDDRPGAVADALAAFQMTLDDRMVLVTLEFVEWADMGVPVTKIDDQAHIDLPIPGVIQKTAAGGRVARPGHGPARGVHHQAFLVSGFVDLPDFLDADTVMLWVAVLVEFITGDHFLAQMTAAAFGQNSELRVEFESRLPGRFPLAFRIDAHVAGGDAFHAAVIVIENLGGGETGKYLGAEFGRLIRQPAAEVAQGNDVVPMIAHRLGYEKLGKAVGRLARSEVMDLIAGYAGIEWRASFSPVGEQHLQRSRLEHRAGEYVRAHFRTLFQHANGNLPPGLPRQLQNAAGRGQTRGSGADDDDVDFHGFPCHELPPYVPDNSPGRHCAPRRAHVFRYRNYAESGRAAQKDLDRAGESSRPGRGCSSESGRQPSTRWIKSMAFWARTLSARVSELTNTSRRFAAD